MYDHATTQAAIDQANAARGVDLRVHTHAQVDAAIAYLADLYDPDRRIITRRLTPDEAAFVSNERTLCALDFRYWLSRYCWIVGRDKVVHRFRPNVAQSIIIQLWGEEEAAGHAIWLQELKARQLGMSTLTELGVNHRFQFHANSACLVASADPKKSVTMAGMIKFNLENQPWWLLPVSTKTKHGMPAEFGEINSTLAIEAGNQFTGVGRGTTPSVIHLSECCEYQDADDIISGGLMRAVNDFPNVFGILESTAIGMDNWWHKEWLKNKREYARGTARVRPIFLPWFVGTDLYPTVADMRKRPIPPNWIPDDRTIRHAEKAKQYVQTNPLLLTYLAKGNRDWQMPREQMYWYEIEFRSARENKDLHTFLSECPADEFEAFQIQQSPIIDQEIILGYMERTRVPLGVYTIVGPDIPPIMTAPTRQWDTSKPTITISTRELLPRYDVKYQLIPLIFHGYDTIDEQLKLLVWEWPSDGYFYGIGVDCAEGVGLDNAVIEVLREATPLRETGQVAEWASNTTTAFQLWPLVLAVGTWYSTISRNTGERAQCRLAIETWTNGAACQHECQKRGWSNFHPHMFAGDARKPKRPGDVNRIGVMTNAVLRATIQDWWMTCLKEESIDIPSPYLVQEIAKLENVEGKAQASLNSHDDRWMSLGFPLYSLHMNKPPAQQFQRKRVSYAPGLEEDQGIAHPVWTPPSQSLPTAVGAMGVVPGVRDRRHGMLKRFSNPNVPIKWR